MAEIQLKKPVTHDEVTYTVLDFDPTVGGLEAFERAVSSGDDGIALAAMIDLLVDGTEMPADAVRKIRQSDLQRIYQEVEAPLPLASSQTAGQDGEAPAPMLRTS